MNGCTLVLASRSPARRDLLRAAGYRVRVRVADLDEMRIGPRLPFERRLCRLAQAKATFVAEKNPDAYVVGADTALSLDGEWIGKVADAEEARCLLQRLAGRRHRIGSAVCVIAPMPPTGRSRPMRCDLDVAWVTLRAWSPERIRRYVQRVRPFTCAGAYALQDRGRSAPICAVEGDPSTIVGLPLPLADRFLKELGYPPEKKESGR